jgi:hypothetical protein
MNDPETSRGRLFSYPSDPPMHIIEAQEAG